MWNIYIAKRHKCTQSKLFTAMTKRFIGMITQLGGSHKRGLSQVSSVNYNPDDYLTHTVTAGMLLTLQHQHNLL